MKPKKRRPKNLGRPVSGRAMDGRWSIRLPMDVGHEIEQLARMTDRTFPAMTRILLAIGLANQEQIADFEP